MCHDLQALVHRAAMRFREGDLREMRRTGWLQNKHSAMFLSNVEGILAFF
jgi:hypothetical protein